MGSPRKGLSAIAAHYAVRLSHSRADISVVADKTPDQLTSQTTASDADLVLIYDSGASLLKKQTFVNFVAQVASGLSGLLLIASNNLSDLASASSARANLGLGTVATLASSAVFQVANNLSEVANAATARANIGAAAAASPTITGGMTFSGSTKANVQAIAAANIDWSLAEVQTKSISTNTTFTFSNITASVAQSVLLYLTITSGAVPTWPTNVRHSSGAKIDLPNGTHLIGLVTPNGGTDVDLIICGFNVSVPA